MLKVKRVYEAVKASDGVRILVDRLWPRGISARQAQVEQWLKELAPTGSLRSWFAHDPQKWGEFKKRYFCELKTPEKAPLISELQKWASSESITLLYAAKDTEHNNAIALKEFLESQSSKRRKCYGRKVRAAC